VREVLDLYDQNDDWELAYEQMILKYGAYSPIHAIINTIWVVLALLYGRGDFGSALGLAVACGLDTGSNAASVGSVMGAVCTTVGIPPQWTAPLHDTLSTALAQFPVARISELARRTADLAESTLTG
jgi:ADP-ribosylglycohydrolase